MTEGKELSVAQQQQREVLTKRRDEIVGTLNDITRDFFQDRCDEAIVAANVKGRHIGECVTACDGKECLIQRKTAELNRVDEVIDLVDDGTYGVCIECGSHISEDRLKIIPEAERCCTCEADHEEILKLSSNYHSSEA